MKRLVVIGGGISGLSAAHRAAEDDTINVVVLEKSADVGGKACTRKNDGWLVETGPLAYLDNDSTIEGLEARAGLDEQSIEADEAAARRFIVRGGSMRQVSAHPLAFARSGILGVGGLLRLLAEPLIGRGPEDESVWDFASRRLGRQAADRLIAPMVLGVFAGDAKRLSMSAAFPLLTDLERQHGSLIRGMIARRSQSRREAGGEAGAGAAPAGGPAGPGGTLRSFRDGMQSLPRGLAASSALDVRCSTTVEALERLDDGGWTIRVAGNLEPLQADAVILACEAWAMAPLLAPVAPDLARLLEQIPYPPVVIVALGFDAAAARRAPTGFGALIPRGEGYRILGCLFDSRIFAARAPTGALLVRAFLGGAVDPETTNCDDSELVRVATGDVQKLLGLQGLSPIFSDVVRWERAIPQYEIGHLRRVAAIETEVSGLPGLFLAGNSLHGIAYAKAAAAGLRAGDDAIAYLSREHL